MDSLDRSLVNLLQDGIEVTEQPYRDVAARLGISEEQVVQRIGSLLEDGYLSRFGPMFDAEKMGGAVSLCAMQVPPQELDEVANRVNAFSEVAHNYERSHALNMWFVVATEHANQLQEVLQRIESITGYPVYNMPKLEEYFIGLRLDAGVTQ
jgi:DNA-binding Lrp family transcriptional regulator